MKKIINGKVYNTETATEIYSYDNGLGYSDFGWMDEKLYMTKKGSYFLAGQGGAMSKYARSCGQNSSCEGSGLSVLEETEAIEWLESHNATEALESFFADKLEEA